MANIKIIDLPTGSPESTSFIEATQVDELAESGRATVKLALNALGNYVAGQGASPLEYGDLETESTTLIGGINELHDSIGADAYDDTATYNTGDYCIYGGALYKCNDDNVTGTWNAAKWGATTIDDELTLKQNSSDNSLDTTNKTIVGAINELKNRVLIQNLSTTFDSTGRGTYNNPVGYIPISATLDTNWNIVIHSAGNVVAHGWQDYAVKITSNTVVIQYVFIEV